MQFKSLDHFLVFSLNMDLKATYALEFYDYGSVLSQILYRTGNFRPSFL